MRAILEDNGVMSEIKIKRFVEYIRIPCFAKLKAMEHDEFIKTPQAWGAPPEITFIDFKFSHLLSRGKGIWKRVKEGK